MNLLISGLCLALLCLASFGSIAPVSGMFFELPDAKDDDFMGGIKQYFGSLTAATATPDTNAAPNNNKTAGPVEESSGFYDEVDTALEHATDTVDGLWQQFRKGLLSLMGSFSGSDGDVPTRTRTTTARAPIIKTATNKVISDAAVVAATTTTRAATVTTTAPLATTTTKTTIAASLATETPQTSTTVPHSTTTVTPSPTTSTTTSDTI